ncbi:hypothetical protein ZOSMA_258G00250 [Zostera marina]|uniref:Uncharacterized protein n=1 Tax=Zostera marina TaxID=29655 RepID=A0A0K9PHV7_ZOSMR|nr:hypothetical protein ZOSMA_258G00250 [Zostera marina]
MMISSYYLDQCDCLKATEEESRGSLERIQKSNKVSLRVSGIEGVCASKTLRNKMQNIIMKVSICHCLVILCVAEFLFVYIFFSIFMLALSFEF